jgi:hypothetical protein
MPAEAPAAVREIERTRTREALIRARAISAAALTSIIMTLLMHYLPLLLLILNLYEKGGEGTYIYILVLNLNSLNLKYFLRIRIDDCPLVRFSNVLDTEDSWIRGT